PFNVNTIALHCAAAAIEDHTFLERSVTSNTAERSRLHQALVARGFECLPSQANFITFDLRKPARPVYNALLREGIIVRPLEGYDRPTRLRVTVGNPEKHDRFLAALDRVCNP